MYIVPWRTCPRRCVVIVICKYVAVTVVPCTWLAQTFWNGMVSRTSEPVVEATTRTPRTGQFLPRQARAACHHITTTRENGDASTRATASGGVDVKTRSCGAVWGTPTRAIHARHFLFCFCFRCLAV